MYLKSLINSKNR